MTPLESLTKKLHALLPELLELGLHQIQLIITLQLLTILLKETRVMEEKETKFSSSELLLELKWK